MDRPVADAEAAAAGQRLRVGDVLPAVLTIEELAAVLGVGERRAYDLQRLGELKDFEITPRIGNKPRYSGARVQAWIEGKPTTPEVATRRRAFGR
jgi:hypothetical protein